MIEKTYQLHFILEVKPDWYPPVKYYIVVKNNLPIDLHVILNSSRKILSPRRLIDFVYEMFVSRQLSIQIYEHSGKEWEFDRYEYTAVKYDYPDSEMGEILAGLGEKLVGNYRELDKNRRFILNHLQSNKCKVL